MLFEASILCYDAKWMLSDPEIIPNSPDRSFSQRTLGTLALEAAVFRRGFCKARLCRGEYRSQPCNRQHRAIRLFSGRQRS